MSKVRGIEMEMQKSPTFSKHILGQVQEAPQQQQDGQMPVPQDNMPAPPQANPFAAEQGAMGSMPDVPINYGGGMTEVLLGDTDIPEEIRKKFWFIFNKDNVLTFLDEDRKRSKLLNLDIIKIDILNSTPYYDYTFDLELEWDILRNAYETKLDRALGFKGDNMKNERIVLQSQFSESKQISEQNIGGGGNNQQGFFKRLLGRR